jgi:hypothetical protein
MVSCHGVSLCKSGIKFQGEQVICPIGPADRKRNERLKCHLLVAFTQRMNISVH